MRDVHTIEVCPVFKTERYNILLQTKPFFISEEPTAVYLYYSVSQEQPYLMVSSCSHEKAGTAHEEIFNFSPPLPLSPAPSPPALDLPPPPALSHPPFPPPPTLYMM